MFGPGREREGYIEEGIFYKSLHPSELTRLDSIRNQLEVAANRGFVPRILSVNDTKEGRKLLGMSVVEGPTLFQFAFRDSGNQRLTCSFAIELASLFEGCYGLGIIHEDPNISNIMYNPENRRFTFVDIDSMAPRQDESMAYCVRDFCDALNMAWLKENTYTTGALEILEDIGELEELMPENWPAFQAERERRPYDMGVFMEYSREPLESLYKARSIDSYLDPKIKEFVLKGINPNTTPDSFDELRSN